MNASMLSIDNTRSNGDDAEPVKILVIDDDLACAQRVSHYARQKYRNAVVDTCDNPAQATTLCLCNSYDLLLIDHNLPGLTGSDFLYELQRTIDDLPPPAIVLAADAQASAAGDALRANAYDFLPKGRLTKHSLARSMENAMARHGLHKSIQQRSIALEETNRSLQEKSREIREFYQTVSHEVKTPLAANREFVSLVRDGVLGSVTEEQAEALDYALASCDQITSHFNALVEVTRLDAGKITLHKEPIALKCLLRRTRAACAQAIADRNIDVSLSVEDENHKINVDGDRLTQVLSNLLANAVKYTPPGGHIDISFDSKPTFIQFCVADSGCGIEEKHWCHIFNRLYQVGDDRDHSYSGAGMGLGLSIARDIVALHSGHIWVESKVGSGSRFYIKLPQ